MWKEAQPWSLRGLSGSFHRVRIINMTDLALHLIPYMGWLIRLFVLPVSRKVKKNTVRQGRAGSQWGPKKSGAGLCPGGLCSLARATWPCTGMWGHHGCTDRYQSLGFVSDPKCFLLLTPQMTLFRQFSPTAT